MTLDECRAILEVAPDANLTAIRQARRKLLLRYHPDHNRGREEWATEHTQRVLEAYHILTDRLGQDAVPRASSLPSVWPTFHQDVRRRGNSTHRGPRTDRLFWAFDTGGPISGGPVLDCSGNVCFGSKDGTLYCVSPQGALRWKVELGAFISATPTIGDDGTIYIGTEGEAARHAERSYCGQMLAIEPGGVIEWSFPVADGISGSVGIAPDGQIYFGGHDGVLYALNGSGKLQWKYAAQAAIYSSPAIDAHGRVYFSAWDRCLYGLTARGRGLWQFQTARWIRSSPTIGFDGRVIVGSNSGHIHCIDSDGKQEWQFPSGEAVTTTAAMGMDGRVYVGSSNRRFYALATNGTRIWDYETGGWVLSSPAVGSDHCVYFGSCDRHVYCLRHDGSLRWKFPTGGWVRSSPAIGLDGTLYVGSDDGKLYAFRDW
jgi:outer membrane protein assembly factor BamB